jgi:hypothetical protein
MRWSRDGHYDRGVQSLPAIDTGLGYAGVELRVEIEPRGWNWQLLVGDRSVAQADYRNCHHPHYFLAASRGDAEREAYSSARQRLPIESAWDEVREKLRRLAGR